MRYTKEYTQALEDLVTEKLLPAYIEHCRRAKIDPNTNEIIRELLGIMKKKREIPFLLQAK
jgi:hypothetical protein